MTFYYARDGHARGDSHTWATMSVAPVNFTLRVGRISYGRSGLTPDNDLSHSRNQIAALRDLEAGGL